jgi:hypothetical protein
MPAEAELRNGTTCLMKSYRDTAGTGIIPSCVRIGSEVRLQGCQSCGEGWKLKVFSCDIHGECTLGKKLETLACCSRCNDYKAAA